MKANVLIVPGIGNSGAAHWQTLWEQKYPNVKRINQLDWDHPNCDEWAENIDLAVKVEPVPPVLVSHSLGCLCLARWLSRSNLAVKGVLMVAVPDSLGPKFPKEAIGFVNVAEQLGNRHVVMVSSENDPYSSPSYTASLVSKWNVEHIELGMKGHINASSGLSDWIEGWNLVEKLVG